jgi:hypothetical protein
MKIKNSLSFISFFLVVLSGKLVLAEIGEDKENQDCVRLSFAHKTMDLIASGVDDKLACLKANSPRKTHERKSTLIAGNANSPTNSTKKLLSELDVSKSSVPEDKKTAWTDKNESKFNFSESETIQNLKASANSDLDENFFTQETEDYKTTSKSKMVRVNNNSDKTIPASTISISQSDNSKRQRKPAGFSELDFSTPSSPGARMIGIKGDLGSVSTPNELAVKLLNGLNSDGNFQPGVAIDFAPYLLASGPGFTLSDYRKSGFQRFLANTKISIATASSDQGANLGLGAEFIILNDGDPRFDDKLFDDLRAATEVPTPPPSTPAEVDAFNSSIKDKIIAAKKRAKDRSEQKETWVLGIGTSLVSSSSRYYDLRGNGMGVWTTYKRGMGSGSEIILHGEYRSKEKTSDRNGGFVNVDTATAGVRIRTGDDKFKFSLETAYNYASQDSIASNSYLSLGLGAEPKISDNLWLSLSMTGNIGRQNGNDVQVFSGLKWNFNSGQ